MTVMNKTKSVAKNTIMNMFLTASQFIFPLISFPYISRVLGAAANGKISFAASVVSYFSMFASLGIPTYGVRACAKCRDNKAELSKCAHELLIINLITTVISYSAFCVLMFTVPKFMTERKLFFVVSSSIFLNSMGMEWLYQALEEYSYITIRSVAAKFISIILMFLYVRSPDDYIIYGGLTILSSSGAYIWNMVQARKIIDFKFYGNYNLKQHLKPIVALFASSVAISIYCNMDSVMIGFMHGDFQNGLYSATIRIKQILLSITASLTVVLIPRMAYCFEKKDKKSIEEFVDKGMRFSALLAFPIAFFCVLNSRDCMVFIAGEEYAAAKNAFFFQSLCVLVGSFSSVFSNQILIPYGNDMANFRSMCVGTAVNLVLNWFWIKPFGAAGAAAATLVTECAVCFALYTNCKKILPTEIKLRSLLHYLLACLPSFLIAVLIASIVKPDSVFLRLMLSGCVSFAIYFLLLYITKEPVLTEIVNAVLKKFKKSGITKDNEGK